MSKKSIEYYFEKISEIWGGIILFFPFLTIGAFAGFIAYKKISGTTGLILGVLLAIIFILIGIYIVVKSYRGKGTIYVISRTIASPELDKKENDDIPNKDQEKNKK